MNIEFKNDDKEFFKPVSITVTFESKKELEMAISLHCMNISIPELLDIKYKKLAEDYLNAVHNILSEI